MSTTYIAKISQDKYDLVVFGLPSAFSFQILSTMNWEDYDFLIQNVYRMKTTDGPHNYVFPISSDIPETRVILSKNAHDYYCLILNLGAILLSEMDQREFIEFYRELVRLPSMPIGSKIIFEPVRNPF